MNTTAVSALPGAMLRPLRRASLLALAFAPFALAAQVVPAAPAAPGGTATGNTIELSPFVVATDRDTGWVASSTLVGNRTNEELRNVPMSIDAITSEFMQDMGAYSLEDAGQWIANLDVVSDLERKTDDQRVSYRGMQIGDRESGQSSRNFFLWYSPTDTYNVERIDFSKGSNSLMFGDASPGGQATVYTKRPRFRNFASAVLRLDSERSHRVQLDVNRKLSDRLALRLNLVDRADRGYLKNAVSELRAAHGTVSYQPFKHTLLRLEAEGGQFERTRANNQVRVRENSAPGRGFGTNNQWYYTSDGEIVARVTGNQVPTVDTFAAGGSQLPLLEGMSATVNLLNRVGTANVPSGQTLVLRGYDESVNLLGTNDFLDRPYTNVTAWVEQAFGDLRVEVSYNQQHQRQERNDNEFGTTISVDRAGRPYLDSQIGYRIFGNRVKTGRATASYPFTFGKWMTQFVVLSGESQQDWIYSFRQNLVNTAVLAATPTANLTQHRITVRAYLDDPRFPTPAYWDQFRPENLPTTPAFRAGWIDTTDTLRPFGDKRYMKSQSLSSAGRYFDGRLRSIVGVRYDRVSRKRIVDQPTGPNGERIYLGPPDAVPQAYAYDPQFDIDSTTYTGGLTYALTPAINLYVTQSESFRVQGFSDFTGKVLGPVLGETREAGIKTALFGDKLHASVAVYEVERNNARFVWSPNVLSVAEMEDLFNPNNLTPASPDYFFPATGVNSESTSVTASERATGYEATVQMQRTKGLQARVTFSHNKITAARDMSKLRALTDSAIERTRVALAPAGNPALAENQALINDALEILGANEGTEIVTGSRSTPNAINWALDYEFPRETPLKGTRLALSGNWRDRFAMTELGGTVFKSDATHPLSAYAIHRRKIVGQNYSFRLGVRNFYDLKNNAGIKKSGVVRLDAAGKPLYDFRYTTPVTADFTVSIDF